MRIWFHGTDELAARRIVGTGFKPGTWFAAALEDALEFGGPCVFMVALPHEPTADGPWQVCVPDAVPHTAIVRLTKYTARVIVSHPERLEAVFDANQKAVMKAKALIVCAALAAASSAAAQSGMTMMVDSNGTFFANWTEVTKCAKRHYATRNPDDRRSDSMNDDYFHSVSMCRWTLAIRHAVWLEAGRSAESDSVQPVAMSLSGDFKSKLVCDYSGLDKNGMGSISCSAEMDLPKP